MKIFQIFFLTSLYFTRTSACWGDGTICFLGTSCNNCCKGASYWPSKVFTACGYENKWADGTACALGSSCNQCQNAATYWWSKAFTACGAEPKLTDGTACALGSSCNRCQNSATYWWGKAFTACGAEPKWPDGTVCGLGTTCNACQNPAMFWNSKAFTACGQENPPGEIGDYCDVANPCAAGLSCIVGQRCIPEKCLDEASGKFTANFNIDSFWVENLDVFQNAPGEASCPVFDQTFDAIQGYLRDFNECTRKVGHEPFDGLLGYLAFSTDIGVGYKRSASTGIVIDLDGSSHGGCFGVTCEGGGLVVNAGIDLVLGIMFTDDVKNFEGRAHGIDFDIDVGPGFGIGLFISEDFKVPAIELSLGLGGAGANLFSYNNCEASLY